MLKSAGIRMALLATVFAGFSICQAAGVNRIDIYDKSDNHLLFVTFDYDAAGANIGRSVFASDSTFLRHTTFQPVGTAIKESSIDFDSNLVFATTIGPASGGNTPFSTVDQFGLDQFGGTMSYSLALSNNYTITQNNALSYTEQYQFGTDGTLNRINILDKTGSLLYYALSTPVTGAMTLPHAIQMQAVLTVGNRGLVRARFDLVHESRVCLEVYTLEGRRATVLVDRTFDSGKHLLAVSARAPDGSELGNGAYIVRLTINGATAIGRKFLLQR